jgi:hypothetical protein
LESIAHTTPDLIQASQADDSNRIMYGNLPLIHTESDLEGRQNAVGTSCDIGIQEPACASRSSLHMTGLLGPWVRVTEKRENTSEARPQMSGLRNDCLDIVS